MGILKFLCAVNDKPLMGFQASWTPLSLWQGLQTLAFAVYVYVCLAGIAFNFCVICVDIGGLIL